ncbi:MFS transporter [Haematomicrobium sanguinis]|uniref:MFS transporter n=1 Tax=Haematomicrobium sanguinis TaxID=479106 RepID=UPI000A01FDC6|nr:MFS transporter [Haematomicrobium sanguinis]
MAQLHTAPQKIIAAPTRNDGTVSGGVPRAGFRQWISLAVLTLPVVLVAADSTILGFAVPSLSRALEPSASEMLWIIDVYSFVLAGLLVTMGTLGDKIGRKKLLLIGSAGFGVASVIAAFAPDATSLIAARAALGIAGATLMPSTLSMLRDIFRDNNQRRIAIGIWSAAASAGAALGPIAGGFLLEHFWWGSVFLVNVPVIVAIVIAGAFLLPESRNPHPAKFDILSSLYSLAGILPVVFAIKHMVESGFDLVTLGSAAVGGLFLAVFIRRQRVLRDPMIDVELFKNPRFSTGIAVQTGSIFALAGSLFVITQYLQLVLGMGPMEAAFWLIPAMVAEAGSALLAAAVAKKIGVRPAITIGMTLVAVGFAIAVVAGAHMPVIVLGAGMFVLGFGTGLSYALSSDAIMGSVQPERAGSAAAVAETAYEMGHALGVAILGSILAVVYRAAIDVPATLGADLADKARSTLGGAMEIASDVPNPAAAKALTESAQGAFLNGFTVLGIIASALMLGIALLAWKTLPKDLAVDAASAAEH